MKNGRMIGKSIGKIARQEVGKQLRDNHLVTISMQRNSNHTRFTIFYHAYRRSTWGRVFRTVSLGAGPSRSPINYGETYYGQNDFVYYRR